MAAARRHLARNRPLAAAAQNAVTALLVATQLNACMPYTRSIPDETRSSPPPSSRAEQPPLATDTPPPPLHSDEWLHGPALFVSHAFDPRNIPGARTIAVVYQNVLTTYSTARATGTLRSMKLDVDMTLRAGELYQFGVVVDGREYSVIITSRAGDYPSGQAIHTDASVNAPLNGETIRIESATLNEPMLRQVVSKMRAKYAGTERPLLALDWESAWLERILNPSHPGHSKAVRDGARALDIAREEWPEAAISFYGSPWGTRSPSESWYDAMASTLQPMLDRMDWLAPSIYDKLKDSQTNERSLERGANMQDSALRIACRVARGRPIIVWVTHRHYQPGTTYHTHLIEEAEFVNHVDWAWNFTERGERIDGFVLWYTDRESSLARLSRPAGSPPQDAAASQMDEIERRYSRWLQSVLDRSR